MAGEDEHSACDALDVCRWDAVPSNDFRIFKLLWADMRVLSSGVSTLPSFPDGSSPELYELIRLTGMVM